MALAQNQPEKENQSKRGGTSSFFKKKTARRAKSLGKDHWDDVIFGRNAAYYCLVERFLQNYVYCYKIGCTGNVNSNQTNCPEI